MIRLILTKRFRGSIFAIILMSGCLISSCDDNGLTAGDPNYFTTSRGQFTATLENDSTMYFLNSGDTVAAVTYDGSNPLHWQSSSNASVNVTTYCGDVVVPSTITYNGTTLPVTAIGDEAFMGCRKMTICYVPSSVKTLGEGAFCTCTTLKSVVLPDGITKIPSACFGCCPALTSIDVPSHVTSIDKMAYDGCNKVASISLPEGLDSIGYEAFFDCYSSSLTEVTIPSTVTYIGADVFSTRASTTPSCIVAYHVKAVMPPTLSGELYNNVSGTVTVYVSAGSLAAYQSAENWKNLNLVEE